MGVSLPINTLYDPLALSWKMNPPGKVVCVVRTETLISSVGDAADSKDPQVTLTDPRHLHREVIGHWDPWVTLPDPRHLHREVIGHWGSVGHAAGSKTPA
jgi:hypothetical protein